MGETEAERDVLPVADTAATPLPSTRGYCHQGAETVRPKGAKYWGADRPKALAMAIACEAPVAPADRDAAVEAGLLAEARVLADRNGQGGGTGSGEKARRDASSVGKQAALHTARAAHTTGHQGLGAVETVDWSPFGQVIPVLAASPGVGATVVAAVLGDALQLAGRSVLMVDTADPARSGLSRATRSDGPRIPGPHPAVWIRVSWRASALVARAETSLPVLAPGMLPPPPFWYPRGRRPEITVVDIGYDPWRVTAHPLVGAGAWLRPGRPAPRGVLVVRASTPSLAHAEQVLARLEPWIRLGAAVAPVQLVVVGAKRWSREVAGSAGRRVHALLPEAVFVPHDPEVAIRGVTSVVTPSRLRAAVIPLLRRWDVIPGRK